VAILRVSYDGRHRSTPAGPVRVRAKDGTVTYQEPLTSRQAWQLARAAIRRRS
jgi:hypothetical protein